MKRNRFLRILLVIVLLLQILAGLQFPAYALDAPQLAVDDVGTDYVDLSWDAVSDAEAYEIWRSTNTGSFTKKFDNVTDIVYSDTTVTPNNKYRYKVLAKNPTEASLESNIETVYTDFTPPSTPANLRKVSRTTTSITLAWNTATDSGMGIANYKVFAKGPVDGGYNLIASPTGTTYTHQSLTSDASYFYYVTAVDVAGNESSPGLNNQNIYTLPVDTTAPTAPANLSSTSAAATTINLAWDIATDDVGVDCYVVYRSTSSSFANPTTTNVTSNSCAVSGLQSATTYYFKVKAKDETGNLSAESNLLTVSTQDNQPPTAPTALWARATSRSAVQLTWNASTDNKAVTGYDVFRATASGGPFTKVTTDSASPATDSGLSSNTRYYYCIKAKDAAGNLSESSSTVSVYTNGDSTEPSTPQNLALTLVSNTQVRLNWSASTDNTSVTGYKIYRAVDGGTETWIASTTSNSYTNTGLTSNESYSYYVRAYDAAGNESDNGDTMSIYTSTSGRTDEETIDPQEGGILELAGLVKLEIPDDAYDDTADYKAAAKSFSSYSTSGYKTFGQPVEITCKDGSSNVTEFDEDLTLTFYYSSGELGSVSVSKIDIYYWDDNNDVWVAIPSTVNSSARKVTADIDHLTVFALLADTTVPAVPTLSNANTASTQQITLSGKVEKNAEVEILFNGLSMTFTADGRGNFSKQVNLNVGSNEVRLRAEDAAGNQSSWSSTISISYTPKVEINDIRGHWAENNIRRAIDIGVTSGYEDRTFRPNRTITRAEFCKFVVSSLGYSPAVSPQLKFKDAGSIPQWARGFVTTAVAKGLISGYNDGTFQAGRQISRMEMASILIRAMNLEDIADSSRDDFIKFSDANQIPNWARGSVVIAIEKGVINGYSDNTFGPVKSATRAEAVTMIIKMLDEK